MKKTVSILIALCLLLTPLTGCGKNDAEEQITQSSTTALAEETDFSKEESDMFTERDGKIDYNENESIRIQLNGTSASASSDGVKIDGTTITITENATHIISGTLDNGQIIVNAPDTAKLQLVLNGVNITSKTSAPLYIAEADKVFVTLVGENALANGGEFTAIDDNNIDGALFSKQDLTVNGTGSLTVISPAGHGIVCKDDLVLNGGTYTVSSASHAIQANDSIRIKDACITATAGKDGLHAENADDSSRGYIYMASGTLKLTAEGDGISAGGYLQIENGSTEILAGGGYENGSQHSSSGWGNMHGGGFPGGGFQGGGGEKSHRSGSESSAEANDSSTSMKGLKAENGILISNGTFKIDSADDAIHSNTSLTINGGAFEIASGDDAIHAEESLTITTGNINISASYEGIEALHIYIKGGDIKLIATDDGLNAAGGTDQSGMGGRDEMFGGGRPGGGPGGMGGNSNGSISVSGGTLYINSSGDGMDANGTLEISGGHVTVVGPTQGDTATLDYDKTGVITGGTFIGTGASNMAQTFSSSEQGVIAVQISAQSAGTAITLTDKNGDVIISYTPELSFQVIILSTPDMVSGEKYTITVGSQSGEFEAS